MRFNKGFSPVSGTPPLSTRGVPHSPSPVGRNNCGLKTLDSSPRQCPWAVAALPSLSATLPRRRPPALGGPPKRPFCQRTSLDGTPSLPPNPPRRTPLPSASILGCPTPRRPHSSAAAPLGGHTYPSAAAPSLPALPNTKPNRTERTDRKFEKSNIDFQKAQMGYK